MTVTPFRAGRLPGENPAPATTGPHPATIIPGVVLLADISEFQPSIDDAKYLAWSQAVIIRAAYGAQHDDHAWYGGARRDALHAGGARFVGCYQYVVAGQDTGAQAREFARLIGKARTGEFYIADIEEGGGNLSGQWQAWQDTVTGILGAVPLADYSGRYFARDHGLQPVDWIASYGTAEPPETHLLWQFTDAMTIPGIPGTCDCSVFHGSVDDLAAHAYGHAPPPPPPPPHPPFPYPAGDYLGLQSPDPHCHSGFHAADQPHVRTWQAQLAHRGWTIAADGHYGPQSDGVCRAYQAEKHLSVDGKVGPQTWGASWTAPVS